MIKSFAHRGLKRLYEKDDASRIGPDLLDKVRTILLHLEIAETVDDMRLPGFRMHMLKGDLKGYWAVTVRANWRIIFQFSDGEATKVDLLDYH